MPVTEQKWAWNGVEKEIQIGMHETQNERFRSRMEDRSVVSLTDRELLCGVFDGHNGDVVASWCRDVFHEYLSVELEKRQPLVETLHSLFLSVDRSVCSAEMPGGSAVGILYMDGEMGDSSLCLYSANVGDVEAFLFDSSGVRSLTSPHLGSSPDEGHRVRRAGGAVVCGRVYGVINITRSIGDSWMKECIIAEPHVSRTELSAEEQFVVLASDGLWGSCSVDKVGEIVQAAGDVQSAAERLVGYALEHGSTDNTTAIVVRIAPWENIQAV
ncbi:MAG: protein serine/threonine phosphatase 2C [Amphiamblys sp. WSBS2006]|nr:MAG: protein serine/threonine phosphatase 2C [Amphiamblys sp. WSBS2006]